MDYLYRVNRKDKPILTHEKRTLQNAANLFNVGDWIELIKVGVVTKITKSLNSPDVEVDIGVVEDAYSAEKPSPLQNSTYQCVKCLEEFKHWQAFESHYDKMHKTKKSKPKSKVKKKIKSEK